MNWKIPMEWPGADVFVVGGGTSVPYQRPHRLEGKKVIAINSAYETVPFAQYLFFGDSRWHEEHRERADFKACLARGMKIVTVSQPAAAPYLLKVTRVTPDKPNKGLTTNRTGLSSQRTSFQGAINLAAMLGARRIFLLGLDGTRGRTGLSHHHKPHKWVNKPGDVTWDLQYEQLKHIVEPLEALGVQVVNTNPWSRCNLFPKANIERVLESCR